jgi:hypothetical protein
MVAFAVAQENEASSATHSSSGAADVGLSSSRSAESSPVRRRTEVAWTPTSEHPLAGKRLEIVPNLSSPPITGAQIPTPLQQTAGTQLELAMASAIVAGPSNLVDLPRRRLVTSFEPHLRRTAVERLCSLFQVLAESIGQPRAAIAKAELLAVLKETYCVAISSSETRTFGSAISVLQDFLRPHWSQLSAATLRQLSAKLASLGARPQMNVSSFERFYREMTAVMGGGIFVDIQDEDEDESSNASE